MIPVGFSTVQEIANYFPTRFGTASASWKNNSLAQVVTMLASHLTRYVTVIRLFLPSLLLFHLLPSTSIANYYSILVVLRRKTPVIPQSFAPRSILQSLEMQGVEVFMHGDRSGNRTGVYSGLRVANIEAEMEEGVVTTVTTLEYSITGLKGGVSLVGCPTLRALG
jgi:hypothetical protein